jgi:hypothetical protein
MQGWTFHRVPVGDAVTPSLIVCTITYFSFL